MILVLHAPRCGSTFFAKNLAKEKNYEFYGRAAENPNEYNEEELREHILKKVCFENVVVKSTPSEMLCVAWEEEKELEINERESEKLLFDLCQASEKVYILHRRSFEEQLKSFAIADQFGNFHSDIAPNNTEVEAVIDSDRLWKVHGILDYDYRVLSSLSKKIDCEFVCYEDWANPENRYKHRNVKVLNPESFKNYLIDTSNLFE